MDWICNKLPDANRCLSACNQPGKGTKFGVVSYFCATCNYDICELCLKAQISSKRMATSGDELSEHDSD